MKRGEERGCVQHIVKEGARKMEERSDHEGERKRGLARERKRTERFFSIGKRIRRPSWSISTRKSA